MLVFPFSFQRHQRPNRVPNFPVGLILRVAQNEVEDWLRGPRPEPLAIWPNPKARGLSGGHVPCWGPVTDCSVHTPIGWGNTSWATNTPFATEVSMHIAVCFVRCPWFAWNQGFGSFHKLIIDDQRMASDIRLRLYTATKRRFVGEIYRANVHLTVCKHSLTNILRSVVAIYEYIFESSEKPSVKNRLQKSRLQWFISIPMQHSISLKLWDTIREIKDTGYELHTSYYQFMGRWAVQELPRYIYQMPALSGHVMINGSERALRRHK